VTRGRDGPLLSPTDIRRQDQRGDLAPAGAGRRDRIGGIETDVLGAAWPAHPGGHGAGQGVDVRLERGVESLVVGGVVPDDVDDRAAGPAGVVQIGQAVGQAGAEMQESGSRPPEHPPVSIRGSGGHPFEETQDAT
jgi:hypothetical protein